MVKKKTVVYVTYQKLKVVYQYTDSQTDQNLNKNRNFCVQEKVVKVTQQTTKIACKNVILQGGGCYTTCNRFYLSFLCFLQGIGPRVLWIGIGGSIFFGVLERTKQILAQKRPPSQNSIPFKDQLQLTSFIYFCHLNSSIHLLFFQCFVSSIKKIILLAFTFDSVFSFLYWNWSIKTLKSIRILNL